MYFLYLLKYSLLAFTNTMKAFITEFTLKLKKNTLFLGDRDVKRISRFENLKQNVILPTAVVIKFRQV